MSRAPSRTAPRDPGQPPPAGRSSPAGAALPPAVALTAADRAALLDLARTAIAAAVGSTGTASIAAARARHRAVGCRAAAFVTLTEDGELRGCIGHLDPRLPVEDSVINAAVAASLDDPRFAPVRREELPRIHVEVSVLGPIVPLPEPGQLRLGIDGIIVERGGRRGLLLPEVAPMLGNDQAAMFETACRKAGLPGGAWRDPATRLSAFRTDRFGGPALADDTAPLGGRPG